MTTDLRRTLDDERDVVPRASTVGSPAPVDGAAAPSACPGIEVVDGRDRPMGADEARIGGPRPCPDPQYPVGSADAPGGWKPMFGPVGPVERGRDRSPESLALLLVKAAERVRTDPGENFVDCAVRWSVDILRSRLDERMPATRGRSLDA